MAITYLFVDSFSEYIPRAIAVRIEVFVLEQLVPIELEIDALDREAVHEVVLDGDEVVGTLRVLFADRVAKIGRVALKKAWRNRNIGKKMMSQAMKYIQDRGYGVITLDAQVRAVPFYQSLGFKEEGETF